MPVFLHPVHNSATSTLHHVHGLSVASFCMQVHLARDSVALTAEWPNSVPRASPSVQGPEGPTPRPPYLPHFV